MSCFYVPWRESSMLADSVFGCSFFVRSSFFGDSWSDNKIIRKKQRKGWPCECIGSRARLQLGRSNGQNWLRVTQVHMFHTGSSFTLYSGLNHEWIETFLISGFWLDSASILVLIGSIYLKWWTVHSWAGSETSDGPWICIMCIRCIRCCIHQQRTCKWLLRTSYVFQWKKRSASMLPSTTTFQATKQLIRAAERFQDKIWAFKVHQVISSDMQLPQIYKI